jgi:phosphotriesterase-related protein
MPRNEGQIITVLGPVAPEMVANASMHEHLHCDMVDIASQRSIVQEKPDPERLDYLLKEAVPLLRTCRELHGMTAYLDVTMPPWRGWPDIYTAVSRASGVQIILCTGFYREMESGAYWIKTPDQQIWPYVRTASEEDLAAMCIREITEGIHGTGIRAGAIKLGTSSAALTPVELKTFRAGAQAQIATGVHITTHCTALGAESSQLAVLDAMGVNLERVCIGHVAQHLNDPIMRRTLLAWMKRGASFMPTNLNASQPEHYKPLVEAIHTIFDAGHGDKLVLGLDHGFGATDRGPFGPVDYLPQPPFSYLFDKVLPAFRAWGLTPAEEHALLTTNPRRLLSVHKY